MDERSGRLDSWKAIADYLDRDVRTAMRWAKSRGLPVRRVGGRGRSVFAFRGEIDLWLASSPDAVTADVPEPEIGPTDVAILPPRLLRRRRTAAAALAVGMLAIAVLAYGQLKPWTLGTPGIEAAESSIWITHGGRRSYPLSLDSDLPGILTARPPRIHDIDADGVPEAVIGVAHYVDDLGQGPHSGALIISSLEGGLRWRFGFSDTLAFRGSRFDGPWVLSDWSIRPAPPAAKIAVAAHDHTWWASLAAVVDDHGTREATFVNPGWIESLLWLDARRLAIAGFNNARDAAMFAIIDTAQKNTIAPGTEGTAFNCQSCVGAPPAFYATFSRSELNLLTAARFNRGRVVRENDRIVIRTIEVEGPPSASAIYEFDRDLRLLHARYDDAYWDIHRRLQLEGRLTHSRETCPDRNGPPAIDVWREGSGWVRTTPASVAR